MQKILFLLFFFPIIASAQLDFESYKGKLDFVKLPEIENVTNTPFSAENKFINTYSKKLPSFKLSKENYRTPVSMSEAMATREEYIKSDIKISLDPREYGVFGNSSYSADSSTKVKNTVYKDAGRGFFFADTCPPYGICPRCAPYKMGRRYY